MSLRTSYATCQICIQTNPHSCKIEVAQFLRLQTQKLLTQTFETTLVSTDSHMVVQYCCCDSASQRMARQMVVQGTTPCVCFHEQGGSSMACSMSNLFSKVRTCAQQRTMLSDPQARADMQRPLYLQGPVSLLVWVREPSWHRWPGCS